MSRVKKQARRPAYPAAAMYYAQFVGDKGGGDIFLYTPNELKTVRWIAKVAGMTLHVRQIDPAPPRKPKK